MNAALLLTTLVVSVASPRAELSVMSGPTAVEQQLLADATDGNFDNGSLLETALMASGRSPTDRQRLLKRYDAWVENLASQHSPLPRNTDEKLAAIFARSHRDILTGDYCATCSDVGITLETGDFNCLTATILFIGAARQHGLKVEALATEGHVFCQAGEDAPRRIETTCAKWFELDDPQTRPACDPHTHPRRIVNSLARPLTDVQLIAKVYYNRGVAHFRASEFEQGLALTRISLRLDPDDNIAHGNILAGLNNWALDLCRRGDHVRALELIEEVRRLDANYPTLEENTAHIYRCWAKQDRAAHAAQPSQPERFSESRLPRPRLQPIY